MEGSLVDDGSGVKLSGRGNVTWTVTSGRVGDCAPQAASSSSRAELNGEREGEDLILDIDYPPATVVLQTLCVGRDGGVARGGLPVEVVPAPVTLVIADRVEARRMDHRLKEPAALLNGVQGAEAAGSVTIDSVAARHYTFDGRMPPTY
jgi:hypothetical protein